MIETLLEHWRRIGARERRLIGIGLAVLLPATLYLYVWQPLTAERAALTRTNERLRVELAGLRADAAEAERLRSLGAIGAGGSPRAAAESAASRFRLDGRMRVEAAPGSAGITVNFENVPFDAWLRWVGELAAQGVNVAASRVEALPVAGQVRASATLTQAGTP